VASRLLDDWSPEQIAGWLAAKYPENRDMRVSHETIYRSLYLQTRNVLHRQLLDRLRTKRRMRRGKSWSTAGQQRGRITDAVSIHDRPAEVAARVKPGHWEGDLITGRRNTHIATLVERYSRYAILVRVAGKDSASVVGALIRKVNSLPAGLFLSLTWDRGTELALHKHFTEQTGVPVFFCDPKSPWQRGTNENTNGLVRQHSPSGVEISGRVVKAIFPDLNLQNALTGSRVLRPDDKTLALSACRDSRVHEVSELGQVLNAAGDGIAVELGLSPRPNLQVHVRPEVVVLRHLSVPRLGDVPSQQAGELLHAGCRADNPPLLRLVVTVVEEAQLAPLQPRRCVGLS